MASPFAQSRYFAPSSSTVQNNTASARQPSGPKPPPVDLPALQSASRTLSDQITKDVQAIPDIGDALTSSGSQASGAYSVFPDDLRVPFQKRRFVNIPDALFQYYDNPHVTSHMGLMPSIERAWITIDNKLFLWDYSDGTFASFMEQPEIITHVALVKPKPTLFVEDITELLVICTSISVLLIGVALAPATGKDGHPKKELKLYATDLSVSTDIEMTSVIGTQDGRIFMCGIQDGNLYELHYQATESWFGKRVQLVNHSVGGVSSLLPRFASSASSEADKICNLYADHKRKCFYALTRNNAISVYTTGGDKTIHHLQTLTGIPKSAQDKAPGAAALNLQKFTIITLHVLDPAESRMGMQLIATTSTGCRLFFGPAMSYGYTMSATADTRRPLALLHVRLPPVNLIHPDEQGRAPRVGTAYSMQQQQQQQNQSARPIVLASLDSSAYIEGLTIAAQMGEVNESDFILCLAPDLTRIGNLGQLNLPPRPAPAPQFDAVSGTYVNAVATNRPPYTEYATVLTIPGRTWAMAALPSKSAPTPAGTQAPSPMNELATQFTAPPHQFMLLTNVGLTFLTKRRALDYLKAALEELQNEANVQPIIEFRDSFGRDQTCAMLLALASGNTQLDLSDSAASGKVHVVAADVATVAKQAFYDFGERPLWNERHTYGTTENTGTAVFSGRREGFALYFAKLVRPFWKAKLTKLNPTGVHVLNADENLLLNVQKDLMALRAFLNANPHLFHSSPSPSEPTTGRAVLTEQEAWKAEQNSVAELQSLLTRTIEALSFVLLLSDYNLGGLVAKCDAETQKLVSGQSFEELITTQHGMTISRALVNVVIDQQIGQQISVDTISDVLQSRCGSFCSTDDVMLYKAKENIRKAAETHDTVEKQRCLSEALRLFTKGARVIEFEKLREIIGDFQQLDYATGAVTLPLICAQAQDTDNNGLDCWRGGMVQNDPRTAAADQRTDCYELVLDSLSVFEEKSAKARPANGNAGSIAFDAAEAVRMKAYDLAFESEDEMFASTLYDWIISRGLADDLLAMRPTFLEAFLKRDPATVQKYELLWQFYVKSEQPLRAAEVLSILAESTQFTLDLGTRIEYLTLAVANAKSHPVSAGGRHETAIAFLTELEEKLEVAQVQLEIYNTLLPHVNDHQEVGDRINQLSTRLYEMDYLYREYAIPFDLPAIKLLCLHVSEVREESIVRSIWNQIFEEIMEETNDPKERADIIRARVVPLGQRFYPSESAFPIRFIATLLVRFMLNNKESVPSGWAARILVQCGVRFAEIWDIFHEMYESQVPPFNAQANVQAVSSEIATLISDWLTEATRPQATVLRAEFPAGRIDGAVDQYLSELEPNRTETRTQYENAKRELRRWW